MNADEQEGTVSRRGAKGAEKTRDKLVLPRIRRARKKVDGFAAEGDNLMKTPAH